ncbi:solute carrier family 12 member 9-like isoform X2 [Xenopus laevis]|uniref:Solute carrier family 12 member 9 n=1 Tax=Xenopus laevis TaxID=8355 RepID=A0A8J1MV77_XENLA|nr:solute carrier family 12 member 9-like isoform X2 [Xenopus laevis]
MMTSESSPLLHYRLFSASDGALGPPDSSPCGTEAVAMGTGPTQRKLSTFFGVVVPTVLSMFSIVLFMRIGFVVGHAGLLQSLLMLFVAYVIIWLTVLSVCAISTNGAVQGGGAYFMISRTLGPEFGGSIGLMFYLANVFACGVYVLGLVEAVLDVFGRDPSDVTDSLRSLPQGYGYSFLYASIILLLCMAICLVGASIYSQALFFIFLLVFVVLLTILISFLAVRPLTVSIRHGGNVSMTGVYTGINSSTLHNNLQADYSLDYTTGNLMNFATVFAVMFNGCTGIMAGCNLSGELKQPSRSIPIGTIIAVIITFFVYLILFIFTALTCDRTLLREDYGFFRAINIWPPFVLIGVYATSLSASMSTLIGASRILHALAKDDLFGVLLAPAKLVSKGGNPWGAVMYTWALVQLVLLVGKLNTIAGIVTVFYLIAYAAIDLACLALEWASAPNFRPTFRLFSWHTCLLGIVSCLVMMFLINPAYASGSIVLLLLLLGSIHFRSSSSSWGYISQALIFHQVRKYLLLLDVRKDHVKFWRPQILLLVSNPRTSCQLINFVNDLKKGGLFILGHVETGDLDSLPSDPVQTHYSFWLSLVDKLNVKAFVDLTLCPNVRQGTQHLLRITGLGGMKPNTVVLGFYDDACPDDYFLQDQLFTPGLSPKDDPFGVDATSLQAHFPPVRDAETSRLLSAKDYVSMICDALKMHKNIVLARNFPLLFRPDASSSSPATYIDVWPLDLLRPQASAYVDVCSLFLLQMACILNMAYSWRRYQLRVFLCVESRGGSDGASGWLAAEAKFRELLSKLRIRALIRVVAWDRVAAFRVQNSGEQGLNREPISSEYLNAANSAVTDEGGTETAVRFLYLPRPPADSSLHERYLEELDTLTSGLGPTLLIHGLTPVTCTEL